MNNHTLLALPLLAACTTLSSAAPPGSPATAPATAPQEARDDRPPITLDLEAGTIDLAATMVAVKPDWLELIATTRGPNSRDHEAIVTLAAKPSHIHLALVTLGLQPGHPLTHTRKDDQLLPDPAAGPAIQVLFVYQVDGKTLQTPAHQWVVDQQTAEPLPPAPWLFTGSVFRQWKGREYYMADEAANAVSLVNFGDDLIVRQTPTTESNDFQQLQLNEEKALPYGSKLTLRLRLIPKPQPAPNPDQPSDKPPPTEP